ncbi:hypothetical protein [Prosthecobacter sp.]|uniref:hypothetical protein n=1 Tax=Prosthecobacter sp. TaxID=1965333 RepID=UPI003784F433
MNSKYRLLLPALMVLIMATSGNAQDAATGEPGEKRVQYQLVLPEEKTPENVKPEEHNPFESANDAMIRQAPGDTEENRVRDKLLKLPVVGVKRMPDGRMRVLLGDIILETGSLVPAVLPEQLVELKVKNITAQCVELEWQEKRFTGLPPKLMLIPIKISPQVRYQLLGQTGEDAKSVKGGGTNAKMDLPLREIATNPQAPPPAPAAASAAAAPAATDETTPQPLPAQLVADDPAPFSPPRVVKPEEPAAAAPSTPEPMQAKAPPLPTKPAESPPAANPPSPAVESMVRMLFGNPTPSPK